jgi:hypothetical protein
MVWARVKPSRGGKGTVKGVGMDLGALMINAVKFA